jgi:fumarate reductase subunit C
MAGSLQLLKMSAKHKPVYIYPVQLWLTCALIGPIIFHASSNLLDNSIETFLTFCLVMTAYGFLLSIPSFFLLLAAVVIIDWHPSRIYAKKLIIACWAVTLVIAPIWLITGSTRLLFQKTGLILIGSYLAPLLLAVFYYRWPNQAKTTR